MPLNVYGSSAGFSIVEVVVATFLIAITLIPAIEALSGAIQGSAIHAEQASNHSRLIGKMEEVLAKPFKELLQHADTAASATVSITAYSDDLVIDRPLQVFLSRYDGDNADGDNDGFTGTDDGLLWLQVTIAGSPHHLETLTGTSP